MDNKISVYDENFEVRSTLQTIKANTELLQTLTGRERRTLREQNRKLRQKVNQLRGIMMEHYDSDWIECRDIGHVWGKTFAEIEMDGIAVRLLTCERCSAERSETYNSDGYLLSRRYNHPKGYLLDGEIAGVLKGGSKEFWRGIEYLGFQNRRELEIGDE